MHRVHARGTAYIPAKFRRHWLKNNREIRIPLTWKCWMGILYFVSVWPGPLIFESQNVYRSSTSYYLLTDHIWEKSDEKRQTNGDTHVGPIFKDCLLVTVAFVLWPCKCTGILYYLMSMHLPIVIKNGWKMTEKSRLPVFPIGVLVTLTFDFRIPKCIHFLYKSLSIILPKDK